MISAPLFKIAQYQKQPKGSTTENRLRVIYSLKGGHTAVNKSELHATVWWTIGKNVEWKRILEDFNLHVILPKLWKRKTEQNIIYVFTHLERNKTKNPKNDKENSGYWFSLVGEEKQDKGMRREHRDRYKL